jgi:molybdopterin/thiamine biosynthesis adenylyltransferase
MKRQDDRVTPEPSFTRHSAWFGEKKDRPPIHIVGCGAVGSNAAMLLARLGFTEFHLYDGDVVEDYNCANQAFGRYQIGMLKTEALEFVLTDFRSDIVCHLHGKFTETTDMAHKTGRGGFVFLGVDSFSARRSIVDQIRKLVRESGAIVPVIIDFRLGFDFGRSFFLYPLESLETNEAWYHTLKDDNEVTELPCTMKICPAPVSLLVGSATHLFVECVREWEASESTDFKFPLQIIIDCTNGISVTTRHRKDQTCE